MGNSISALAYGAGWWTQSPRLVPVFSSGNRRLSLPRILLWKLLLMDGSGVSAVRGSGELPLPGPTLAQRERR